MMEVTDIQWIKFAREQLTRKGTPPDDHTEPRIPLLDKMRPALTTLLDEAEAEPHSADAGAKIGDVIFAIGMLDVTGRLGPFDGGLAPGVAAEVRQSP